MPREPLGQKLSWANALTEIAGWESPWSVSASPSSGGAENSEEATAAGASFQRAVRRKFLVGAVGIEPTTFGLKGRCSTTELRPYWWCNILQRNGLACAPPIGHSRP